MPFSLTILGSNSAAPTSERFSSAQVLKAGGELLLLDCAEGTQIQLRRNRISLIKINHIFISHLHGDHFFGLIGLLTTLHLLGRKEKVHVYGPELLRSVIDYQLDVTQTVLNYLLEFHTVDPSRPALLYENKAITVRSIPLLHRLPTCGFIIREKEPLRHIRKGINLEKRIPLEALKDLQMGKDVLTHEGDLILNHDVTFPGLPPVSYAYCTDTGFSEGLASHVKGISCLFHEATFMEKDVHLAREKQHSTAKDAARIAAMAEVGQLIIGHFSSRYKDLDPLLAEAQLIFPRTELAADNKTFLIDNQPT